LKTPKGQSESVYRRRTDNTIPLISTQRTITSHLYSLNTTKIAVYDVEIRSWLDTGTHIWQGQTGQ